MEIIERLPNMFHPDDGDEMPPALIGAKIVRMGTLPSNARAEGGGLVIEYRPRDSENIQTIIFEFNELGMWISAKRF